MTNIVFEAQNFVICIATSLTIDELNAINGSCVHSTVCVEPHFTVDFSGYPPLAGVSGVDAGKR